MANSEMITLGAGCFWCIEAVFQDLKGVEHVESGYANGHVDNPTYQQVCGGRTGHAEVAQITFDPDVIAYAQLLEIFWRTHDPTTLNRQGNDVGTQYRSAIFYQTEAQKEIAEQSLTETSELALWPNPIVTEIAPLGVYYSAENYHQNYFKNNPHQPYCMVIVNPKVRKFRAAYKHLLKG